ncbi:dihydrofolate reductase family protein [Streptosporangiaceae bacterium NEAU-GS5]|nr:dihydrofolate reductase family protein [Streptosporangiaceae bacterium NEAU-GS5]
MRKLRAVYFISLDGVVESPDKWHFPYFSDEMGEVIGSVMTDADAVLMGRSNFLDWQGYWPGVTPEQDPFAAFVNNVKKYVVSSTLDSVTWNNTEILRGGDGLADEITRIKEQPGKGIYIQGSPTLVRALLREGLVDELVLLQHPIVVGSGQRLFDDFGKQVPLKLAESKAFPTGVLALTYVPAEN